MYLLLSKVGTKNSPEIYRLVVTLLSEKEKSFNLHQAKKLEEIYRDLATFSTTITFNCCLCE